jgi:membrane-bound lytic murein transglycosylase D
MQNFCKILLLFLSQLLVVLSKCQVEDKLRTDTTPSTSILQKNDYDFKLNPRAIAFVEDYIKKNTKELEKMRQWGKAYFNLYDGILKQYNIPVEMKYLSVVESHLRSNLVSWAGAVGPWQLMDYEAKRFGLKVKRGFDERTDYIKSTHVACKIMNELYDEFGDWLLVVAAYNGGAGRVKGAIRKSKSRSFWDLQYFLAEETRTHVKKFIATHYLFEGDGSITTQTAAESKSQTPVNNYSYKIDSATLAQLTKIEISGRYKSSVICNFLQLHLPEFQIINFNLDKELAAGKKFSLKIPKDKEGVFNEKKNQILEQSIKEILNGY